MLEYSKIGLEDLYGGQTGEIADTFARRSRLDPRNTVTLIKAHVLRYSTTDTSNPPTNAELDAAFGIPSVVGKGYSVIIDDNGTGDYLYLCISDGTNWWQTALTKAV